MNKVILIGRLTADPDVRYTQDNLCIARYSLAVDRPYQKGKDKETDFLNCVAFGKKGEFAEKYLTKGIKIGVTGRIQTGSYKNREGVNIRTTDIIIDEQEFVESKATNSARSEKQETRREPEPTPKAEQDEFMSLPEDFEGLPFN